MSKAYVLLQFDINDPEQFDRYRKGAAPLIVSNGGRVLVAAASADVREGELPAKLVTILEFPSREAAEAWYGSTEYAAVRYYRHDATSAGSLAFLEGFVPPV